MLETRQITYNELCRQSGQGSYNPLIPPRGSAPAICASCGCPKPDVTTDKPAEPANEPVTEQAAETVVPELVAPAPAAEPVNQIIDDAIPVEPVAKVIASERVEESLKPVTEPEQVTARSVAAQVIPLPDLWQPPKAEAPPDPVLAAITAF